MANRYTQTYPSYQQDISSSSSALLHPHEFGGALVLSQFGTDGNHRSTDPMQASITISPYPDSPSPTTSPSSLVASNDGQDTTSSPPRLPDSPDLLHSSDNRPRKQRKEKQRIDLAPDQPPTTQGRPRARVFVACVQCRGRKIRCDGAKPVCFHCSQREGNEECTYDNLPKRRGPDRVQGARTRSTRPKDDEEPPRRRRRRPTTVEQAAGGGSYGIRPPCVTAKPSALDTLDQILFGQTQQDDVHYTLGFSGLDLLESSVPFGSMPHDQTLAFEPTDDESILPVTRLAEFDHADGTASHSSAAPLGEIPAAYGYQIIDISPDPSVQFGRKTWWDHVLYLYAVSMPVALDSPPSEHVPRDLSVSQIVKDVRYFFQYSSHWFSFFNVPRFYNNFMDPERRSRMQPSLLLSLLAISTFLQSPGRQRPEESRRMAVLLKDEAQGYLEASLLARAIDEDLAQAAWILTFFEVCGHPQHQLTRVLSSLNVLDSIIRSLAISYLDCGNPTTSKFPRNTVPVVEVSSENHFTGTTGCTSPTSVVSAARQYVQQRQIAVDPLVRGSVCPCKGLTLGVHWPEAQIQVPFWVATPMWNPEWTEAEIKKEECRRLCWSTLMLVSGHTSFAEALNWRHLNLFVLEQSNYSILFPGESLLSSYPQIRFDTIGGKDTVWALYLRAMLLWNACVRMRHDAGISELDRREFAMRAWFETEEIEKALQWHTCDVEKAFMYHGREYLFNTRMCISYEFQRFIPHVLIGMNRQKSEEWLRAQGSRAKALVVAMQGSQNKHYLVQRPWYLWWFMGQVFRALTLWQQDNSLTIALDVCQAFLEPIEFLTAFYPGTVQQRRSDEIRERLQLAQFTAEATVEYVPTPIENVVL